MSEQINSQQPIVDLSGESSSNSLTRINPGTSSSMTTFQVPIYTTAGMPYIPSPPTLLPESPLGLQNLQQIGSPQFSQGFPVPYPVGLPTRYGSFPFTLPMPWNGGSDSQSYEGTAPRTWRKVSNIQLRSSARTPYLSASRRLPKRYIRPKVNSCNSYIRKNGSRVTTSPDEYNVSNTNIQDNLHPNPAITTAVGQSNSFDNQVPFTTGSEHPLSTSVTCANLRHSPIAAWNSCASRESNNNRHENRVEGRHNCPARASQRNDCPSPSSPHNVEVINIADENPTVSRACDTHPFSATSLTSQSYPKALPRKSTKPRIRSVVEQTSRKSTEYFPGKVQDPLRFNSFLKPSTTQRKYSRKPPSDHGANSGPGIPTCNKASEKRTLEFRPRLFCYLCWKSFLTVEERFLHYGKIHHLSLSSLDIHIPLINTSNPADVGYLNGLGIEKCIPLNSNYSKRELAIPIINVDDKGHLINPLQSWNAVDVLDFGPIYSK